MSNLRRDANAAIFWTESGDRDRVHVKRPKSLIWDVQWKFDVAVNSSEEIFC